MMNNSHGIKSCIVLLKQQYLQIVPLLNLGSSMSVDFAECSHKISAFHGHLLHGLCIYAFCVFHVHVHALLVLIVLV